MINISNILEKKGVDTLYGVPDSLLAGLINQIEETNKFEINISPNEGIAVAAAIGYYIATSKPACVFMQNSGIGNAYNPLISLASKEVLSVPIILLIGWRGEITETGEQISDEPQHKLQGAITIEQLKLMKIPYLIIDEDQDERIYEEFATKAQTEKSPIAFLIRKKSIKYKAYKHQYLNEYNNFPERKDVLEKITKHFVGTPLFCTTGKSSRELYELNQKHERPHDFYCVGGMGHVSTIAQQYKKNSNVEKVICIDGDGALLMHLSSMKDGASVRGFIHILINNYCHESVGGLPTNIQTINLIEMANAFGYTTAQSVNTLSELDDALRKLDNEGSNFIEIKVRVSIRTDLPRPEKSPKEYLNEFMERNI